MKTDLKEGKQKYYLPKKLKSNSSSEQYSQSYMDKLDYETGIIHNEKLILEEQPDELISKKAFFFHNGTYDDCISMMY